MGGSSGIIITLVVGVAAIYAIKAGYVSQLMGSLKGLGGGGGGAGGDTGGDTGGGGCDCGSIQGSAGAPVDTSGGNTSTNTMPTPKTTTGTSKKTNTKGGAGYESDFEPGQYGAFYVSDPYYNYEYVDAYGFHHKKKSSSKKSSGKKSKGGGGGADTSGGGGVDTSGGGSGAGGTDCTSQCMATNPTGTSTPTGKGKKAGKTAMGGAVGAGSWIPPAAPGSMSVLPAHDFSSLADTQSFAAKSYRVNYHLAHSQYSHANAVVSQQDAAKIYREAIAEAKVRARDQFRNHKNMLIHPYNSLQDPSYAIKFAPYYYG